LAQLGTKNGSAAKENLIGITIDARKSGTQDVDLQDT